MKFFYKLCVIILSICLAIECIIFVIGISFNIMNPGIKGVSQTDLKHWLIITLPTIALLFLAIILKKRTR